MTSSSPSPRASMLLYWHENQYDDRSIQINGRTIFLVMALSSGVLFFALVTLYIHRNCHRRDSIDLQTPPSPLTRCVSGGAGLDPAMIRCLPVVLFRRDATEEERECCICLGGFEEGEKMKILPTCHHGYHCECVDRWLNTESSCPLCRVSIRVDPCVSLPIQ